MDIYEESSSCGVKDAEARWRPSSTCVDRSLIQDSEDAGAAMTVRCRTSGGCVEADVCRRSPGDEEEKPRTLTFNLNQDPKYDTGLFAGAPWIFHRALIPQALLYISERATFL